jgi:hypothetical protein
MSTDYVEIAYIDEELALDISELDNQARMAMFVDTKGDLYLIGEKPDGSHDLIINDKEAFKTYAALFAPVPGMN